MEKFAVAAVVNQASKRMPAKEKSQGGVPKDTTSVTAVLADSDEVAEAFLSKHGSGIAENAE